MTIDVTSFTPGFSRTWCQAILSASAFAFRIRSTALFWAILKRRIVAVEPRPAVLVALGKPFQKRIGSFKHGISQQLTEECAGWYDDRLVV